MAPSRATWIFLLLAFAISWAIAEVGFRLLGTGTRSVHLISVAYMFGPALAAIITTRWYLRQPLSNLGPMWRWNRWLLAAIAFPLAFTAAWLMVAAFLPGLRLNLDSASLAQNIVQFTPAAKRAEVAARLAALGDWLLPLMVVQLLLGGVLAGTTLNAVAAFGEELGWRGFLHRALVGHGFWRRAWFIGFFWGLWHLPMTLRGHNYPQHPGWGVVAMVVFCLLLSPLFELVRSRSGGLLAPVWMHGVLNAVGGAAFFVDGSDLLRGPAGLAGMLVLTTCNLLLWRYLVRSGDTLGAVPLRVRQGTTP